MIYSSWDKERDGLKFLDYFLPFYPLKTKKKNPNFEKTKNTAGDIIILHMCTKITIMMYAYWVTECDR